MTDVLAFDVELSEEEQLKKEIMPTRVSVYESDVLFYVKAVSLVLSFISTIAAFALVLGKPDTFRQPYSIVTLFRTGATSAIDGQPEIQPQVIGTLDAALVAASVPLLAVIAYMFALVFHEPEVLQMNSGSNPYVSAFSMIWQPALFLLFSLVSGVSELFFLIILSLAPPLFWLREFWNADLLRSYAYRRLVFFATRNSTRSAWEWLYLVFVFFAIFLFYSILLIYTGFMFGDAATPPSFGLLAIPVVGMFILYSVFIAIYVLHQANVWFTSLFWRELGLYSLSLVLILFATFVSLTVFAFD